MREIWLDDKLRVHEGKCPPHEREWQAERVAETQAGHREWEQLRRDDYDSGASEMRSLMRGEDYE